MPRQLVCFLLLLTLPAAAFAVRPQAAVDPNILIVGEENWTSPWVPNLRTGEGRVPISPEQRIDVLLLADGYLEGERDQFERDVEAWYEKFLSLTPWSQLRGAFRVRGYWTPSEERAAEGGSSYYGTVSARPAEETGPRIFEIMRRTDSNLAAIRGRVTHTTVMMLIRDERGRNPSGLAMSVRESPRGLGVRVGFGAYSHHEFGHAFGGLRDEYIRGDGRVSNGRTPDRPSIFSLTNISHTTDPKRIPWRHLMPGTEANPDPESVIGLLWIGGIGAEVNAWHSEGTCMMNGTHDNWNFAKTRRGVGLRDRNRFCFWCEEIIVARAWALTGQFGEETDGQVLYERWETEVRPLYHHYFDVPARIRGRNEINHRNGWHEAKIFERPAGGQESVLEF